MNLAQFFGYLIFGFVIASIITAVLYLILDYRRWNSERY